MTARSLFVTGTDTGVGKTVVASALLRQLAASGQRTVGYKPVASGCESTPEGLRNDDALALQAAGSVQADYSEINPYAFAPPIAPHLAAAAVGQTVRISVLDGGHAALAARADWVIVEGAGGWAVPLNADLSFGGWVTQRDWPVLLVVGMRLGCINHALLSVEAISRRARLVGWVANGLTERMDAYDETLACLMQQITVPFWGEVPTGAARAAVLDLSQLRQLQREADDDEGPP
jgi:dethiobiotin synthetase